MDQVHLFEEVSAWCVERFPYDFFWIAENGDIVFANESVCKTLGYSKIELESLKIFDVNPKTTKETWAGHWERVQTKKVDHFKTIHRRKDGTEAPMEVFAQFFSNGRKKLVCSLVRDLSDSVMYRELLEQTEAATNVGGWEWNIEEQDLVASAEALRIFDTDEHANLLPAQLSRQILGDHLAIWQNAVRKLLKGEEYDMVFQIQSFKQKEKWIHATAKPYLNSTGKVIKVLGTYQDISTQKSLEISLKIAFNEIEELKLKLEEENAYLQEEISTQLNFQGIITDSDNYKMVLEYIEKVAPTDTTVLITGESGTGKELLARAVHGLSRRKDSPLIKVNCAALPKDLIESELFGHKKGAFTGAISDKKGKFELADGGTLFLDEIGELPIQLQPKLLRVLQEGEFDVLGGTTTKQVDVRIIAATNRDLDLMTKDGTFREDLFYRLNVFPIYNPPLRERKEDIPTLAHFFLDRYSKKIGKHFSGLSKRTLNQLNHYHFPGNIRELENLIERAVITERGPLLKPGSWMPKVKPNSANLNDYFGSFEEMQRRYLLQVLESTKWRVSGDKGAAKILDMNAKTLFAKMKKLGIERS